MNTLSTLPLELGNEIFDKLDFLGQCALRNVSNHFIMNYHIKSLYDYLPREQKIFIPNIFTRYVHIIPIEVCPPT